MENIKLTEGFLQAVGAIDDTHIPIIWPQLIITIKRDAQGVVDFWGVFMDVCIGWPGKAHDAREFSNSDIL